MEIPSPPNIQSNHSFMQTFYEIDRYMREVHEYIKSIKEEKDGKDEKEGGVEGAGSV